MYDPYSYYDGCEPDPKEDWEHKIFEIIHDTVNEKCKDIQEMIAVKQDKINDQHNKIHELKNTIKELEEKLRVQSGVDEFAKLVNEDNIFNLINSLGIEKTNSENYIRGMNSERMSDVTKLVLLYYDNRDLVFDILDLFNIYYPHSLKNLMLPRDYSKDEIETIIKNVDRKMINTNGCYFKDNFGFWLSDSFGNREGRVPLQEVFKNPHIKDCINIIIYRLKDDTYSYYSYLFEVTDYQDFSKDTILKLAKYLPENPDRFHSYHRQFIERHMKILFNNNEFCERYFDRAGNSKYGIFSIHNFNEEYQEKFIEKLPLDTAIALINELSYDEKKKTELIKKVIN